MSGRKVHGEEGGRLLALALRPVQVREEEHLSQTEVVGMTEVDDQLFRRSTSVSFKSW